MKIAIISDTHCGIRNSSDIFMEYQKRFYEEVFFPYLLENGIKNILHLGDYYDNRKTINFKALNLNRKVFLDKLREYGIHMDIIIGNHDMFYKNTTDLNALKELQGHYMNEVNLVLEPRVMNYDGLKMGLVPWICAENEEKCLNFIKNCEADIIGAHLELSGFDMHLGMPCIDGMDPRMFERFEMVLSGHFHTKSSNANIHYLGCQMEFFWNDCNDKKYFHVLDTQTRELTPVHNPLTIFEKVYYDHTKMNKFKDLGYLDGKFVKLIVVDKGDPYEFERFVDRIQAQKIHELKIAEDFKEFLGDNVDTEQISVEDTDQLMYNYIEAVDTTLDKNRIKKEISDLMIEAQTLEIA